MWWINCKHNTAYDVFIHVTTTLLDLIMQQSYMLLIRDRTALKGVGAGYEEKSTKFLGVHIDDTLSWKSHDDYSYNKIFKSPFIITRANLWMSIECLRTTL